MSDPAIMSTLGVRAFDRHIGIDYSGEQTPTSSLKELRIDMAHHTGPPREIQPPPSPRKYWTRRGIAEWLVARLSEDQPTLVSIDHGFSFPLRDFETHGLAPDWPWFLEDFRRHWPTDEDHPSQAQVISPLIRGRRAAPSSIPMRIANSKKNQRNRSFSCVLY